MSRHGSSACCRISSAFIHGSSMPSQSIHLSWAFLLGWFVAAHYGVVVILGRGGNFSILPTILGPRSLSQPHLRCHLLHHLCRVTITSSLLCHHRYLAAIGVLHGVSASLSHLNIGSRVVLKVASVLLHLAIVSCA